MLMSSMIGGINIRRSGAVKKFLYEGKSNISGERVRLLRLSRRLSQSTLAIKMQTEGVIVEQGAISRIENGSRFLTDYEILALTKIFNVSADYIIGRE